MLNQVNNKTSSRKNSKIDQSLYFSYANFLDECYDIAEKIYQAKLSLGRVNFSFSNMPKNARLITGGLITGVGLFSPTASAADDDQKLFIFSKDSDKTVCKLQTFNFTDYPDIMQKLSTGCNITQNVNEVPADWVQITHCDDNSPIDLWCDLAKPMFMEGVNCAAPIINKECSTSQQDYENNLKIFGYFSAAFGGAIFICLLFTCAIYAICKMYRNSAPINVSGSINDDLEAAPILNSGESRTIVTYGSEEKPENLREVLRKLPFDQQLIRLGFDEADARIPKDFFCPISGGVMNEPIIIDDELTYDRLSIDQYLAAKGGKGKATCPGNPSKLIENIVPNKAMRNSILDFIEKAIVEKISQKEEDSGKGKEVVNEQEVDNQTPTPRAAHM